ncbi:MAG: DUF4956 domain-containing protein [Chitinivibrionales bacterium]|nr:DUF4956 domain-containing protein [Chitinivibrionales bacterium]
MLDFLTVQTSSAMPTLVTVIYTILLSFLLSTLIAFTYEKTFRGLSYSRNFIQTLILSSIVAAMIMQAIGDNFARGLGMLGAFAIIRFRTMFKDSRDTIFIFASLASGMACGVFGYRIAIIGTLGFCAVAVMLYYSPFGQSRYFDGLLRFNMAAATAAGKKMEIEAVFTQYCKTFALITLRELAQGNRIDYAYHVKLRDSGNSAEFVDSLRRIESIQNIQLLLQETTVEI